MQSLFLFELFNLIIYIFFSFILSNIVIFLSLIFGYYLPDVEKLAPYECGFDPYEDARNVFDVRFYLIAILFLVFDLEAIFFFPWIVNFSFLTLEGFFSMIDFIFELFIGYIYAWRIGALEWN